MSDQKHLVETFHFLLNCKDFEFICLILFLFSFPHLLLSSFPLLISSPHLLSSSRYDELLRQAGAALSAEGLDEEAVKQTLLRLSQPVEMEDVRREVGRGENGQMEEGEGKEPGPEGRACPTTKRLRPGSEVEPEAKRSRR